MIDKVFTTAAHFEAALLDAGLPAKAAEAFGKAFRDTVEERTIPYVYQYAKPEQVAKAFSKLLEEPRT